MVVVKLWKKIVKKKTEEKRKKKKQKDEYCVDNANKNDGGDLDDSVRWRARC